MQPIAIRYSGRLRLPAKGCPCGGTAQKELGVGAQLIIGDRSKCSVWVNDNFVIKRESMSPFPEDQKMLEAVREVLKSYGE
jgi:hypothetical protein